MSIPKHKVCRTPEYREVYYSDSRWDLLKTLRRDAARLMEVLINCGFNPILHGSLARGDVEANSDIDIVIPYNIQPYEVELCLERNNMTFFSKYIVQATPASSLKAYVELDPKGLKNVSFPLTPLSPREYEFYKFGGLINYQDLVKNVRVPGVNKRLILI
ncbi:MAG: nucleotidyltransferase domain-containing protein, partial [Sulfolobales archaeon]